MTREECEIETSKAIMEMRKHIAELEKACDETQELLDKQIEVTYKLDKENEQVKQILKEWLSDKTYTPKQHNALVQKTENFIKKAGE